jgi:hypothetical protein
VQILEFKHQFHKKKKKKNKTPKSSLRGNCQGIIGRKRKMRETQCGDKTSE